MDLFEEQVKEESGKVALSFGGERDDL